MHEFYILPADKWLKLEKAISETPIDSKTAKAVAAKAEPVEESEIKQGYNKVSIMFGGKVYVRGDDAKV